MSRFGLAYRERVPWWGWLLVCLTVLGMIAFAFRRQLQYLVKVAKALATDERLPRPLRWGLKLALAMKVVPVPGSLLRKCTKV